MVLINPFLLAGPEEVKKYQKKRIQDWENNKSEDYTDFESYFNNIVDQWEVDDPSQNTIEYDQFTEIDGIDTDLSTLIKNKLIDHNILNEYGYINFDIEIDSEMIESVLDEVGLFDDNQKSTVLELIQSIQSDKSSDFDVFSKTIFEYFGEESKYSVSTSTSAQIWDYLKEAGVIDGYGVLQLEINSSELESSINNIPFLSSDQKERVLALLNKHPEISYSSYIKNWVHS